MNRQILSKDTVKRLISKLRQERHLLETHLLNARGQMPVWLSFRYTYCRKGGCKCTKGKPHGPFYYLSFKKRGGSAYRYLPAAKVTQIKPLAESYKAYWERLARLNKINREIDTLLRIHQKNNLVSIPLWLKKKKNRKKD